MSLTEARAKAAWAQRPRLSREQEDRFWAGAAEATRFFMGESDVEQNRCAVTLSTYFTILG